MTSTGPLDERALQAAAERGDMAALFTLVGLLDARGDFTASAAMLGAAARTGCLSAIGELGARTALGAGVAVDFPAASALLEFASEQGDAQSARWLARLAVAGVVSSTAGERAVEFLCRDARKGDEASLDDLAGLTGEPVVPEPGSIDDYADAARPANWDAPLQLEVLSADPLVGTCGHVLSPLVTGRIVSDALPVMAPAGVTSGVTGHFALDAARTNTSGQVAFFAQPMALMLAKRRIAALAGQPAHNLERTNVLRYRPGQSFAPHWDYLDPDTRGFGEELRSQGQRVATCLLGLTDDYEGGETDFPELGLRVRIPKGGMLFFSNVKGSGKPDPRTLHTGLPPATGEKWVASQWMRDRHNPL